MEALREVCSNLWVSSLDEAGIIGSDFDLTIQCTSQMVFGTTGREHLKVLPGGNTNHSWNPEDLSQVVQKAVPVLQDGGTVLIFCTRGRSRSATAAAAVLLTLGEARNYREALDKVRHPEHRIATTSIGGLKRWYEAQ